MSGFKYLISLIIQDLIMFLYILNKYNWLVNHTPSFSTLELDLVLLLSIEIMGYVLSLYPSLKD